MESSVGIRRLDEEVELRCQFCQRVARYAIGGFVTLIDAVNAFLIRHRHPEQDGTGDSGPNLPEV